MKCSVRAVVMAVIAGALGLTLAVVPSQFSPEQAHAAVSPNIPPPISLLPSIISGVTGTGAGTAAVTAKAQLVRNAVVLATVAEALGKQTAGLPLVKTEVDLIADAVKKIRLPAFKPVSLIKAAGPVGLALTAGEVSLMMGNGVVDLVGWGDDGVLCSSRPGSEADLQNAWVGFVNGADCSAAEELQRMTDEATAQANADSPAGVSGGNICNAAGTICVALTGQVRANWGGWTYQQVPLFNFSGSAAVNNTYVWARQSLNGGAPTNVHRLVVTSASQADCKTAYGISTGSVLKSCFYPTFSSTNDIKILSYSVEEFTSTNTGTSATESSGDPERRYECRIKGTDGLTYTAMSAPFYESSGSTSPIVCPSLPSGVEADEFSIWEVGGVSPLKLTPDVQTTPEFDAAKTAYPNCSSSVCLLKLNKEGTDCHTVDGLCADWFEDPDKTTKYTCTNGPYAAPLSECTVYKPTFQPGAKVSPAPYGDPTTGEPLPNSAPNPSSLGGPAIDPAQPRECFPSGWAVFNPVEWVMKPVQCALEWAAVPRIEKVVALQNRASSSWNATTLAKSVTALEGIAPVLAGLSDGNCAGVLIDLGGIAPDVLDIAPARFLPACPGDFFAPWAPWVKSFLVLSLTVGGFFSVKAQLSRFTSNGEA